MHSTHWHNSIPQPNRSHKMLPANSRKTRPCRMRWSMYDLIPCARAYQVSFSFRLRCPNDAKYCMNTPLRNMQCGSCILCRHHQKSKSASYAKSHFYGDIMSSPKVHLMLTLNLSILCKGEGRYPSTTEP